ncbi:hypothetical protein A2960_01070 [Candidatus Gottesmanbacteria bacterium RIFCSPLOWO2_01_FULL_39_12b]|uniref:DUF4012 domain-containing protein n=1 Tax=Candidatus Gottesmanbacteria bacterium RIFCSPLOWO2_01_FULL_39_12b TaxID=1798388 RepID=A0A1F6APX9_9BACT|nr:MAG: hypothetical protein A2960_01070 [Candidatus Gottesmanbacteria bacterium RIFCSPLOWO2_01_FULL_39_12b]
MKNGFHKIVLNINSPVAGVSNAPIKTVKKKNKSQRWLFLGIVIFFVTILSFVLVEGVNLYFSLQKTSKVATSAFTAIKSQDLESSRVQLKELENNLLEVAGHVAKISWLKFIPIIGVYVADASHLVNGGIAGVQAGEITTETLIPYTDLLGLKGKTSFVSGSADDRIKTAVETLDKVTPRLEEIAVKIGVASKEISQVDPKRYPEAIGSIKIRQKMQSVKDLFSNSADIFVDAQPLLKKLPEILGNNKSKNYLVLFQNDAELRATGGFITAYALFKIDKGKMQVIKAEDIYKLDAAKKKKYPAPNSILKYHKDVYTLELRDSNLSPDFIVSMGEFDKMIKESVPDFPQYDGIIALDTHVLVSAIKILGDFNIYGRVFSAENDSRCDCPKAIYELEDYATRPVGYLREERKDIIGILLYQLMQRALGVSPSKYWGQLFQMFLEESKQKHVLFDFFDEVAQKGIESLHFAGKIDSYEGDYLHINNVNFSGAKANMFIKQQVKLDINITDNNETVNTLTINYKNPAPASNCNLEAGKLCLNAILRNWLRVYVPEGATLLEFTGSEKDTVSYNELNKTVFEGFLTVKPQGTSEIKIKYKLPFKVSRGTTYKLFIQKQPGTDMHEYSVLKNGKEIEKFSLLSDTQVSFKL